MRQMSVPEAIPPPSTNVGLPARKATSDIWWKNAIVYCVDVRSFLDSDGDGCGDLRGLVERVDYLAGIGVTCIWLLPFHPSPERDGGYDITDYYGVEPRLGTLGDFTEFVRTAGDRGIRVIADLVVNHTSRDHAWFASACGGRDAPYHDFYVWQDEHPKEKPGDVVFPDKENSNWAWDERVGQWYLHRFYSHQPDLNVANPTVRDEIAKIVGFWMQQGLAGFRVDAVPFPGRADRDARGRPARPARPAARLAPLHGPALGRLDPARRGQPPARPAARVLRRQRRRRAADAVRLRRQPGALPRARPR
jgi:maltose alpha-D-glucosyltransferase/alpha-amylase